MAKITLPTFAVSFSHAWRKLAAQGACDEYGGTEFFRVFGAWIQRGMESDTEGFIRMYANAPPSQAPGEQPADAKG